ncbi:hypothetical protein Mapa_005581 [Marchantia paleacea]|nr:hypothetical protein Mapa_005581 [Marchantia paleacea]
MYRTWEESAGIGLGHHRAHYAPAAAQWTGCDSSETCFRPANDGYCALFCSSAGTGKP